MKPAPPVTRNVRMSARCSLRSPGSLLGHYESLRPEDAPEEREPHVERHEPEQAREAALRGVGEEARAALLDGELSDLERLDDGLGGELEAVVDEVVVGGAHVAEVRLEDDEAPAGAEDVAHLADDEVDLVLVVEMLEHVRAEDDVE